MRVVIQRVNHAQVDIGGKTVGKIGKGLLLLVGIKESDELATIKKAADKIDPGYALPTAVAAADDETPPDRAPSALLRDGLASGQFDGLDALARLCSRDELGAVLHDADMQRPARLAWLLRHGADPDTRNERGDSLVFAVLAQGVAGQPALATRFPTPHRCQQRLQHQIGVHLALHRPTHDLA